MQYSMHMQVLPIKCVSCKIVRSRARLTDQGYALLFAMAQMLDIDDLVNVLESLKGSVNHRWMNLGLALKLAKHSLDDIEQTFNTLDRRLQEMLTLWLKQCYDTKKHGLPTWEVLIGAVRNPIGGKFPLLADTIAEHKHVLSGKSLLREKKMRKKKKQMLAPLAADSMGALDKLPPPLQPAGAKHCSQAAHPASVFKILLFRLGVYLGAIFHGHPERNHLKEVQIYKTRRHNSVLHIIDNSDLQFRATDIPDLIFLCVPLLSDAETRRRECTCLRMLKHSYTEIWSRIVITITVPPMKDFEVSLRKQEKRKKSLTEYISCFRAPSIPSIVCISEDLIGPIPGDPEQLWYTQLWKAIFGACSRDNRLVLMTYLSDRLTETPSIRRSPLLQKIPREAAEKARSLVGGDYFEMAEKT